MTMGAGRSSPGGGFCFCSLGRRPDAVGSVSPRRRHGAPNPEQNARNQQFSEHAQEAFDRGDYEQARAELLRLVRRPRLRPRSSSGWARSWSSRAGWRRRKRASEPPCKRDRDYVEALVGLGQVEAQRGEVGSALKHIEAGIEIDPHRPKAHFSTGPAARSRWENGRGARGILPSPGTRTEQCPGQPEDRGHPVGAEPARSGVVETGSGGRVAAKMARPATSAAAHISRCGISRRRSTISSPPPGGFPNRADIYYRLALALEAGHKPADAFRAAERALHLAPIR